MPDFTLEPDEHDTAPPERRPQKVRLVSTGLAPTAEVPLPRVKEKDPTPAYAPCEACGQPVLVGETRTGTRLALDVRVLTYCVLWENGAPLPVLEPSRGYPVHGCMAGAAAP